MLVDMCKQRQVLGEQFGVREAAPLGSEHVAVAGPYNDRMSRELPAELQNQKYISLTTYRKTGAPVRTPVWFAEENGKLYIFTNPPRAK